MVLPSAGGCVGTISSGRHSNGRQAIQCGLDSEGQATARGPSIMLCRGPLCASVGLGRSVPGSGVLALLSLSERGRWSGGQGVAEEGAHLRERLPRRNRVPPRHGLSGSRRRARSPRPSGPRESERRGKGMIESRRARDGGPSGGRAAKTVSLPVRASRGDAWSCRSDLDCCRHGSFSDCGPGLPRRRRAHPDSGTASPPQGPHLSHLSAKPRLLHKGMQHTHRFCALGRGRVRVGELS